MDKSKDFEFEITYWKKHDGSWAANIEGLPDAQSHWKTATEAQSKSMARALHTVADQIDGDKTIPDLAIGNLLIRISFSKCLGGTETK